MYWFSSVSLSVVSIGIRACLGSLFHPVGQFVCLGQDARGGAAAGLLSGVVGGARLLGRDPRAARDGEGGPKVVWRGFSAKT